MLRADPRLMGTWVRRNPFASKPSSILRPYFLSSDGSIGYGELKSACYSEVVEIFMINEKIITSDDVVRSTARRRVCPMKWVTTLEALL